MYWGDETGIDNCSNCEREFAPKEQPPVLPVETKRERLNMLSALSMEGKIRFMRALKYSPDKVSTLFQHYHVSYIFVRE
ncbi:transposase [Acutalibacter intestini]|uniref:transposase n=1 Tax=Acutalibacter intestini TaxID=3093659 RepID=UPI00346051E5